MNFCHVLIQQSPNFRKQVIKAKELIICIYIYEMYICVCMNAVQLLVYLSKPCISSQREALILSKEGHVSMQ